MLRRASTKIAHNSTIPVLGANHDLKPLQNLIIAEKAVLISLKKLSADYFKASDALRNWGLSEGDHLGDILGASSSLLKIFSSALVEYASHGDFMRKQLKVIRTKEESLDNLKRCRCNARRKAKNADKKLSKMGSDNKNLASQKESFDHLQEEIRKMDSGIMLEEADLNNFKRTATKAWMGLKFGGLVECCQKGTIAGEFGKIAIANISEEATPPGMPQRPTLSSDSQVEGLVEKADQRVNAVALSIVPSVGFGDGVPHNRASPNSPQARPQVSPPTSREPLSEPQLEQQPSPTSTLRDSNESNNPQAPQPNRRRKGQPPDTPVSPVDSSSEYPPLAYVPPYEQQPSQGTVQSSSSQSLPSSQQPGVNEGAVNSCAVHRNKTSSRLATSPINTRLPGSSKSRENHLQDPPPSSSGRHNDSPMEGTSRLTPNRYNGWSQSSEGSPMDSGGDALCNDEPPPSFHDALLARTYVPVVGPRSEGSPANTVIACHHNSVRLATGPKIITGNGKKKRTENNNN